MMQTDNSSNQYVTFKIEDEMYAVDVFKVREILEVPDITRVPGMPQMIRGVINIRGAVVPVLDLKMKFGREITTQTQDTAVIVTEIINDEETVQIGILVDAAREVITLEADEIEEPPKIGIFIDNKYLSGMGKIKGEFVIILNSDKILSDDEISQVSNQKIPGEAEQAEKNS